MEIWRRWIPIWFYFILKLWQWPKVTVTITWRATWGPTKNAVRFDIPQVDQVIWVFFFFSWVFQWKWLGCAPWNCSYDVGNCGDDRKWPPHVENHVQRCLQQTRTYLLLVILTSHVTNHRKLPLPSPHAQPSESKQKITQVSQKKISSGFWREMRGHAEGPTGTFGVSVAEEGVNLTTPILLIWCCCCCCCWGLGRRHHHQRQQKKKQKKKGTRSLIKIESERWKRTQTSTSLLETWYQCAYKKKGWAGTSVARQRLVKLLLSKPVIARTCNRLLGCCCLATDIITWWLGVDDRPSSKVRCFFSPFLLFFSFIFLNFRWLLRILRKGEEVEDSHFFLQFFFLSFFVSDSK